MSDVYASLLRLSLRDYFAAQAMQGMLAFGIDTGVVSRLAYMIADAMLAERGRKADRGEPMI